MFEYDGHALTSATRGATDLSKIGEEPAKDETEEEKPTKDSDIATLIALVKQTLGESVKDVRTSDRLTDSAVCLVADEGSQTVGYPLGQDPRDQPQAWPDQEHGGSRNQRWSRRRSG